MSNAFFSQASSPFFSVPRQKTIYMWIPLSDFSGKELHFFGFKNHYTFNIYVSYMDDDDCQDVKMIAWEMPRYIDSGRAECQMSPGPSDDDEDQESTLQPSSCTRRSRDLWYVHPTKPRSMMSMIKFRGWRWFREAPVKFTQAIFGHCPSGLKNCSVSTNQDLTKSVDQKNRKRGSTRPHIETLGGYRILWAFVSD